MAGDPRVRELSLGDLESYLGSLDRAHVDRALASLARDKRVGARRIAERWRRRLAAEADETRRLEEMLSLEWSLRDRGYTAVAGVDEVGRGALAGPLVTAAVILAPDAPIPGLRDSKELDAGRREELDVQIRERAVAWAVGEAGPDEIDRMGIQLANMTALRRALDALSVCCDFVLADAFELKGLDMPCLGITRGDKRSASIAAASVVAKVARDRMMSLAASEHPGYGFERHVGYGCAEHMHALARLGPSPIHRRSFAPVRHAAARQLRFE